MDRQLKPYKYKQFLLPRKRLPITVYVGMPDAAGYPTPKYIIDWTVRTFVFRPCQSVMQMLRTKACIW